MWLFHITRTKEVVSRHLSGYKVQKSLDDAAGFGWNILQSCRNSTLDEQDDCEKHCEQWASLMPYQSSLDMICFFNALQLTFPVSHLRII